MSVSIGGCGRVGVLASVCILPCADMFCIHVQGYSEGTLAPATQSLLDTLRTCSEDGSLPSIVYTLRSGISTFIMHHPYLCTSITSIDRATLQLYPSAILPHHLYLGTYYQAGNIEVLRALGITHVVNVAAGTRCKFKGE